MEQLEKSYKDRLEEISNELQADELLTEFLENEEDEQYKALVEKYEPRIAEIHKEIAHEKPLQLLPFEELILETPEGLFLPRILAYSVLRGVIDENYRYILSQEQFKTILLAIAESPNFEFISQRIGQTVQVGFALSSDIWTTNLINQIDNKRVQQFLQTRKDSGNQDLIQRRSLYTRYSRQFRDEIFFTTDFPKTMGELSVSFRPFREFLLNRVKGNLDNSSLAAKLTEFLSDETFHGSREHEELMSIALNFIDFNDSQKAILKPVFEKIRKEDPEFEDFYFQLLLDLHDHGVTIGPACDHRMYEVIIHTPGDEMTEYYELTELVHDKGFTNEEVIQAVRDYYLSREGTSLSNAALRNVIYNYIAKFAANLEPADYQTYFDLTRYFVEYNDIFSNQKFLQDIENLSLKYVKSLMKTYTDRRGKDYQDIKKFVRTQYVDIGFLSTKEATNFFKVKRKKKPVEEA